MKTKKIFLSTEIKNDKTAWTKAKVDVVQILEKAGYHSVYFPKMKNIRQILNFWRSLSDLVTSDSHLVVEFPFYPRIRMWIISLFALAKGVKLYAVIHDISDLRFVDQKQRSDMHFLKRFDGLVSHNAYMTEWLRSKGYKKPIVDLQVFDYCLKEDRNFHASDISGKLKILYAGNLSYRKATYIYDKKLDNLNNVQICVYGQQFERDRINGSKVSYKGVFNPDAPELAEKYHFGLIWEGSSTDTCSGEYGQYIRFNNPHKFSLYISLGLPVIVWKEAAIASFVNDHKIGFTIESLSELDDIGGKVTGTQYNEYINNLSDLSSKVRNGFFLDKAISQLVN